MRRYLVPLLMVGLVFTGTTYLFSQQSGGPAGGNFQVTTITTGNGSFSAPAVNVGTVTHGLYQSTNTIICETADATNNPVGCGDASATNYQFDVPVLAVGGTLPTGNNANAYLLAGSSGNLTIGNSAGTANVAVKAGSFQTVTVTTVSGLPTCNAGAEGLYRAVSDATATTFFTVVAGSGANHVPVYCDGTNWRIN